MMDTSKYFSLLKDDHSAIPSGIDERFKQSITNLLDKSMLFYRVFSRCKSFDSLQTKMRKKSYSDAKKLQDLFGVRIILYFKDDILICRSLIENAYTVVDVSEDEDNTETFCPKRLNFVCKIPQDIMDQYSLDIFKDFPIDDTFEIQIRTVLSEGWHEVEHDLRYKCKQDWEGLDEMSRIMNGILATLEMCDWTMISLCEELAYKYYKSKNWNAMMRNKLRIKMGGELSKEIQDLFDSENEIAKSFFRIDREQLITNITKLKIPNNCDNIVYVANQLFIHNETIREQTPKPLIEKIDKLCTL